MKFLGAPNRLFSPLTGIYEAGLRLRQNLYRSNVLRTYHAGIPVLCVGNVTTGGSGKSPFVQYLASLLLENNYRPVILSRGYGGRHPGPYCVESSDHARLVGDEALMHARAFTGRVPVVIARSRARGAQLIEKEKLGNVIVLDDGLQHHGLGRELNILLLDASSKQSIARWETGALLPAGWLRERLEDALGRTDCIVFTYKAVAKQIENKELEKPVPQFSFVFMPDHFTEFASDKKIALEKLHGGSFAAFSSIAAPEHFFNMLRQMNFDIQRTYGFADHHLFSERELAEIFSSGLPLICTEKDAVKIPADYPKPQGVFILALKGEFSSAGAKEGFLRFVLEKLQERTGALVERETAL